MAAKSNSTLNSYLNAC